MIKDVIRAIQDSGCLGTYADGRYTVSNIPSWKMYRLVHTYSQELRAIAVVKNTLSTAMAPIKRKEEDSKCPFCLNLNSKRCPFKQNSYKIPTATFDKGCELWRENRSIYF